ncbi:MAG: hypothetical protein K8S99_12030 [Planctomycetes bacterium]|nr:hypothetical protein [Planctomycetota bacterium]
MTRFLSALTATLLLITPAFAATHPSAEEFAAMQQKVQRLEQELQQLKGRQNQLRKAVQDVLPQLRDRLRTPGSVEKVTRTLERALRNESGEGGETGMTGNQPDAPRDQGKKTAGESTGRNTLDLDPKPAPLPPSVKPPQAGARHAGASFYFDDVQFVPAEDGGFECVGEMVNKAADGPVTPHFLLTVYDEGGTEIASSPFYLAFSSLDQVKIFRVSIADKVPAGGKFTIKATIEPEKDPGTGTPDDVHEAP